MKTFLKIMMVAGWLVSEYFFSSYFHSEYNLCVLPVVAAIIAGVAALAKTGFGIYQYQKGQAQLASAQRPTYVIPPEIEQNLTQAQLQALEGLPAEQKQQFVENIQRAMQTGLRGLTQRGLGVAGVGVLQQQQMDAYQKLLGMDVAARQQNLGALAQARLTSAAFKEREFDINKFQRYMEDRALAMANIGAGTQNIAGGASDITNIAGQYAMYGGNKTGTEGKATGTTGASKMTPAEVDYYSQYTAQGQEPDYLKMAQEEEKRRRRRI